MSSKRSQASSPGIVRDILGVTSHNKNLGVSHTSPFKIVTEKQRKSRETDEMCPKTNLPVVAFEKSDPERVYCEKCVYNGEAENPQFMAVVAGQLAKKFDGEYSTFKDHCEELEEINNRNIKIEMQEKVEKFFSLI